MADSILVRDVALLDGTGADVRRATIVIADDRIVAVKDPSQERPDEARTVINGQQLWAVPGLWDAHAHLANRPDSKDRAAIWLPALLAHGVVGVRDMGGDWEVVKHLRSQLESGVIEGPVIIAPGPFVDGAGEPPDFLAVTTAEEAVAAIRRLGTWGVDFVKIQARLSPAAYGWVANAAHELGLPLAGHVPEAISAGDVIAAGQTTIEHVSPALPGDASLLLACSPIEAALREELHAWNVAVRAPEPDREHLTEWQREIQSALLEECDAGKLGALAKALVRHTVAVVPTLIWSQTLRPIGAESVVPIATPLRLLPAHESEDLRERRRSCVETASEDTLLLNRAMARRSRRIVGALHDAGVTVLAGTDSFDGFVLPGDSLLREIELLVDAGLGEADAIRASTKATTRALGLPDRGSIEEGQRADLLLVEADPTADIANLRRIHGVIQAGRYYSREALDRLLKDAATLGKGDRHPERDPPANASEGASEVRSAPLAILRASSMEDAPGSLLHASSALHARDDEESESVAA